MGSQEDAPPLAVVEVPEPAAPAITDAPVAKERPRRGSRSPAYTLDLVIVRHGPAEDRDTFARSGRDDEERPLTPRGIRQMRRAARGLRRLVKSADAVGTSPLVRARETAAIVAAQWDLAPDEVGALGDGARHGVLRWIRATAAVHARKRGGGEHLTIAIVGHEPDLGALIIWLLTGRHGKASSAPWAELKKGGACLLGFDGRVQPHRAHLKWCLTRSQLERLRH